MLLTCLSLSLYGINKHDILNFISETFQTQDKTCTFLALNLTLASHQTSPTNFSQLAEVPTFHSEYAFFVNITLSLVVGIIKIYFPV
jgi:hypothetical protein